MFTVAVVIISKMITEKAYSNYYALVICTAYCSGREEGKLIKLYFDNYNCNAVILGQSWQSFVLINCAL